MKVVKTPEDGKKFIDYEIDDDFLSFNDGELAINLKKKERDYPVHFDICRDWEQGLVMGITKGTRAYIAQIDIPARQYEYVKGKEKNEDGEYKLEQKPIPFSMDNVTLTLWEEV